MEPFSYKLNTYAQLAVEVGVNVQKGQYVVVNASTDVRNFVRLIVKHAYEKGAKNVTVNWQDDEVAKLKYELAPFEAFEEYPEWEAKGKEALAQKGAAFISVVSSNPDLLKGADSKRIAAFQKAAGKAHIHTDNIFNRTKSAGLSLVRHQRAGPKKFFPANQKRKRFSFCGKKFSKQRG